jgi:hypothetical protein
MSDTQSRHFPIRFDSWYRVLSSALFLPPSRSFVELDGGEVTVCMGWAFSARFSRSAVESTAPYDSRPVSRGVHGFMGRWLVNGSGDGILAINLSPRQRAYTLGFPIELRQLLVSVEDPRGLADALRRA